MIRIVLKIINLIEIITTSLQISPVGQTSIVNISLVNGLFKTVAYITLGKIITSQTNALIDIYMYMKTINIKIKVHLIIRYVKTIIKNVIPILNRITI